MAGISNPNQKINFKYLLKYFDESYYKILTKNANAFLHNNGWLEFSETRYQYLIKTINYLKKYGLVYLVRLPVHPDLMNLENQLMPEFNQNIFTAVRSCTNYLDMSKENGDFQYTDGVHLTKKSGKEVSEILSRWLIFEKAVCY